MGEGDREGKMAAVRHGGCGVMGNGMVLRKRERRGGRVRGRKRDGAWRLRGDGMKNGMVTRREREGVGEGKEKMGGVGHGECGGMGWGMGWC